EHASLLFNPSRKTLRDVWRRRRPSAAAGARPAADREDGGPESLVLQESLGPLQENPFIKLEKERRRRQDRENAARPVQHILELYGSVPGIRTIRADNIIIIDTYSSLNDLLDRRGSAVTEIRAKEVVIYDPALSRSEENLSTLGLREPRVPCSPETRRARAESPTKFPRSSPDYEIRPSPTPDLSRIPAGDAQARALANLRLQSRNSFTVIPKRRLAASSAATSPVPPGPVKSSPSHRAVEVPTPGVPTSHPPTATVTPSKRSEEPRQKEPPPPVATSPVCASPSVLSPPPSSPPAPSSPPSSPAVPVSPPASPSSPGPSPPSPAKEPPPPVDQLPVTNIDDIEVEPPQRVPAPSPLVHRKKGNTFTVVPKRRVEPEVQPGSPEPPQDAPSADAPPGSTPPQAPYAQLGSLLKKRYPAAEEIQVIGGYLSLAKSCLSKTGSTGKKVRAKPEHVGGCSFYQSGKRCTS
uniref:Taperin n=1 Tax=Sphaeramia orbicularis TaxID=375764 RepID=A0A673AQI7_9TELE